MVPTRGMNLWKGVCGAISLGWNSPVKDGPVNPAFVDAQAWGGLGWLDGFDEMVARCGLDSFGPPYEEAGRTYTLHGRISNIPAHHVSVHVEDAPPHAITIEGRVIEARLFHTQIEMVTKITTVPGSKTITIRDTFTNLRDSPSDLQILYHCNFGPPLMQEGGRFVAPWKTVVPRDRAATEGLGHFDVYGPPAPGSAEMVYFFELIGDGPDGKTLTLLRNRAGDAGDRAAVLDPRAARVLALEEPGRSAAKATSRASNPAPATPTRSRSRPSRKRVDSSRRGKPPRPRS